MSELILGGHQLTRSFQSGDRTIQVLRGASIELCDKDFGLLMGPSGSGKSTLLAVLSGLLRPEQGEVQVLGRNLWEMNDTQRRQFRLDHFGFLFQGYNLFPALTAREQLEIVGQWGEGLPRREARKRAARLLEQLGLANEINKLPAHLSGGEKQRVAIGRALMKQPKICFADEPTSALDWDNGKMVLEMLQQTAPQYGATVLVVGHDPRIEEFANRIFHLDNGIVTLTKVKGQGFRGAEGSNGPSLTPPLGLPRCIHE